jgi:signal peptide peptidase SppA
VRQEIERAAYDDAVGAILLVIDSGGGTVAGTDDLWLTLRDATRRKPCWVFCEDITASAAYYVATAAHRVISNASCEIGSLGTIYVFADTSELLSRAGVRVVVIATGPLKGVGCPGTALTEEGRAELQREADFHGRQFMSRVAEGRGWSMIRTKELFTGRIWHAKEALQHGLIDAVGTLRGTIAELRRELIAQSPPPALRSATLGELRAALPQATAEFRETCLVEMLNLEECRERFAALPPVDPLVPCRRPSRQRGPAFGSAWTDVRT